LKGDSIFNQLETTGLFFSRVHKDTIKQVSGISWQGNLQAVSGNHEQHQKGNQMAKLNEQAVNTILEICGRYKDEKTPLMMILSDIQNEYGYIPLEVQEIVSQQTGISVAEIYGVVTFYSFFSLKPKGKYVIGCCLGTACYVKGAQQVIDKFSEILGIKPGETSEDGMFTLDALRCIGACGIAPAVSINGTVYPKMSVDQVSKIVDDYRAKEGVTA